MATNKKTSNLHERHWLRFLEVQGDRPFRRQDFAEVLYQHLRPRKMDVAKEVADEFMERARRAGQLVKAGHVHWKQVTLGERKLLSGRIVRDASDVCTLKLETRCPSKWVAVDLETGETWGSDVAGNGWKRASNDATAEAAAILTGAENQAGVELRAQVAKLQEERAMLRKVLFDLKNVYGHAFDAEGGGLVIPVDGVKKFDEANEAARLVLAKVPQ
ncbi:hypothetical protein DIE18_03430 [Burkholderia sp. Bp9125]|nr:hypothetical protein DIE18_03430 [Burkholderia sp. Bp9125]